MRRGFTIVEILAVVAIIVVIAGLSYPVYASGKRKGYESAIVQGLRNRWMAIELYRQDYEPLATTGPASKMGFPVGDFARLSFKDDGFCPRIPRQQKFSCDKHFKDLGDLGEDPPASTIQGFQPILNAWLRAVERDREHVVILADWGLTEGCPSVYGGPGCLFDAQGIELSGTLRRQRETGRISAEWWEPVR